MYLFILTAITWDVSSEAFRLKLLGLDLAVPWYGLMFGLSFILGQQLLYYIFRKENKPDADVEKLTIYGVVGIILGARLGHFLFYEWQILLDNPASWLIRLVTPPFSGLASHGAAIAVPLAIYLYARQKADQSFLWVADRGTMAVALGGAFIRFGNLMNSEIYGKPTNVPWGFVFVRETDPALLPLVPRHPTQLYESLFCLFLLGLFFWLWKQKRKALPEGFMAGLFLVLLFGFRFFVEFLKNEQASFEAGMLLNMGQLLSIPVILAGVSMLIIARKNNLKSTSRV